MWTFFEEVFSPMMVGGVWLGAQGAGTGSGIREQ